MMGKKSSLYLYRSYLIEEKTCNIKQLKYAPFIYISLHLSGDASGKRQREIERS